MFDALLNLRQVTIKETEKNADGSTSERTDVLRTEYVNSLMDKIKEEFKKKKNLKTGYGLMKRAERKLKKLSTTDLIQPLQENITVNT